MKFGEAFQITISTKDIYGSQKFWGKLGFEYLDGDSQPFSWRILADPSLTVMLNEDGRNRMLPTWYEPDMDEKVRQMVKNGVKLAQAYDLDNLPSLVEFLDPDGFHYLLVEREGSDLNHPKGKVFGSLGEDDRFNPTAYPNQHIGIWGEYAIPVRNLNQSISFWEQLGFECLEQQEGNQPQALMRDQFVTLLLLQTTEPSKPALTFYHPEMDDKVEGLKFAGIEDIGSIQEKSQSQQVLLSPEGLQVFLRTV